jgi:hypothetical protein
LEISKNDAVRILELAFKVAVTFVAKIEEEFSAMRLDALLGLGQIVDLEAEMVRADEPAGVLEVGASLPRFPSKFNRARLITPSLI